MAIDEVGRDYRGWSRLIEDDREIAEEIDTERERERERERLAEGN